MGGPPPLLLGGARTGGGGRPQSDRPQTQRRAASGAFPLPRGEDGPNGHNHRHRRPPRNPGMTPSPRCSSRRRDRGQTRRLHPHSTGPPLDQGHGVSLPSSFGDVLPSALAYSAFPPVSVCGTAFAACGGESLRCGVGADETVTAGEPPPPRTTAGCRSVPTTATGGGPPPSSLLGRGAKALIFRCERGRSPRPIPGVPPAAERTPQRRLRGWARFADPCIPSGSRRTVPHVPAEAIRRTPRRSDLRAVFTQEPYNGAPETSGIRRRGLGPHSTLLVLAFSLPGPPERLANAPSTATGTFRYPGGNELPARACTAGHVCGALLHSRTLRRIRVQTFR